MNDEIKEILSYLKKKENTRRIKCITIEESKQLLDYITNLQRENEKLKTKTKEQSLLLIDYQDMEQKYEDYKSRIEKAVEYINNCPEYLWANVNTKELLNILNVRSDE